MLAMNVDTVVSVSQLAQELWDDAIPRSFKSTIQTYMVQLRKLTRAALRCGPAAALDREHGLFTVPGGYLLVTAEDLIDKSRFGSLAAAGHRARELGDFETASKKFSEALSCWRGPALLDVRQGAHLSVKTTQLEEARLAVLDRRIDADLRLGKHHELIGELAALVVANPSHEGFCAKLMIALHRAGRRPDAMAAYRRLHSSLADDLGLNPSPNLQQMYASMLAEGRNPAATSEMFIPE